MRRKNRIAIIYIACMVCLFCMAFLGCQKEEIQIENNEVSLEEEAEREEETEQTQKEESPRQEDMKEIIWIDVCGAVQSPGVYKLSKGARVFEAIQAAGGFLEEADTQWLNQAAELADGQKIQVYTLEETKAMKEEGMTAENNIADTGSGQVKSSDQEQVKINLNTADLAQLQEIPGIGEVRAQAILDYREEAGGFKSIEEIQEVPGIKGKTFEKIEGYITVE